MYPIRLPARLPAAALACAALAGCGPQPAPEFFGAERIEVQRDDRSYVLHRKGDRVQIIRLGWADPGNHQAIRATMIGLIPELTGCRLLPRALQGDSGEMRATLSC